MIKLITALAVSGSLYNGLKDTSYYGEPIVGVKCSCCSHSIGKHKNHYYRKLEKPKECGELIQACSKAIRCDDFHNNKKLIEEIGDVQCMIDLIHEYDLVSLDEINNRVGVKKQKLKKWSSLYE